MQYRRQRLLRCIEDNQGHRRFLAESRPRSWSEARLFVPSEGCWHKLAPCFLVRASPFSRLKVLRLSSSGIDLRFLGHLPTLETIVLHSCRCVLCTCADCLLDFGSGVGAWPLLESGSRALKAVHMEYCSFLGSLKGRPAPQVTSCFCGACLFVLRVIVCPLIKRNCKFHPFLQSFLNVQ